jgi:hypothetical protein
MLQKYAAVCALTYSELKAVLCDVEVNGSGGSDFGQLECDY